MMQAVMAEVTSLLFAGSSVCNGAGAEAYCGYACQLANEQQIPYTNISVNGVNTTYWCNHFSQIKSLPQHVVVLGLGLGNEGIHNAIDPQSVYNQWKQNILAIADSAHNAGKRIIITNNYPRGDYNAQDYHYVKAMNIEMQQWDIPTVNFLGALDNCKGDGQWADGYQNGEQDIWHPNTAGHTELMCNFVPSLFRAIAMGKPYPKRQATAGTSLVANKIIMFCPEQMLHSFTLSVQIRTTSAEACIALVESDSIQTISIPYAAADGAWHTWVYTHYYAAGKSYSYLDGQMLEEKEDKLLIKKVTIGGTRMDIKDLFFWRAGMNSNEIAALQQGKMLGSSLELYCPLHQGDTANWAQSTNTIHYQILP